MYHASRSKGFFLTWLTFHLWAGKRGFFIKGLFCIEKLEFWVISMFLHQGEGVNLLREDWFFA